MSAVWQKNEPTAIKRRCDIRLYMSDGVTSADRGLNLITLGLVYFCGANSPHFDVALGTMTNKRRPFVIADTVFTADNTTETFAAVAHGMETGDGPVRVANSGGALPSGLVAATDYYVISLTADTFQLATSLANAYAGTELAITTDGTGTQTLSDTASTRRGVDGLFTYEATQTETNHDAPESVVYIYGTLTGDTATSEAYTTVDMASAGANVWDADGDGGYSMGELVIGIARGELAPRTISGTTYTTRDIADTKNSHHGDITADARTVVIDDLTGT